NSPLLSFTGDWLFPTYQSKEIVRALHANGVKVSFCEVESGYGHDVFLLRNDAIERLIRDFLTNCQADLRRGA
ncbi:unnamed protein product, partial [marine sediment metagenome]